MPYAQIHYPMENETKFENNFPGDYIAEYIAQTRAWFFFMHVLSTALFKTNSFKNVVSTGVMAGSDGRKMSKTYGNYTDPKETLETIGGDALRLYLMSSPLLVGENANFDISELKSKLNNVLNPLWNSLKFFDMYAELHKWNTAKLIQSTNVLDVWILARLNQVLAEFSTNIEKYLIPEAVRPVEEFVDDLSRWYVRRSRDRISQGDPEALSTLYTVLSTLSKGIAPIIPFLCENIYQQTVKKYDRGNSPESVHLASYPEITGTVDNDLIARMKTTRDIVSLALAIRTEKGIKVRQPLQTLTISGSAEYFEDLIKDEVNVKNIKLTRAVGLSVELDTEITEELELEGLAREMVRNIQDLRKATGSKVGSKVDVEYSSSEKTDKVVSMFENYIKTKALVNELKAGTELKLL